MIVLLQYLSIFMTVILLLLILTGLLGKLPGRLVYAGIGVSGVLFLVALVFRDPFTIMCQGVACASWTTGLIFRRCAARLRAQAEQQ